MIFIVVLIRLLSNKSPYYCLFVCLLYLRIFEAHTHPPKNLLLTGDGDDRRRLSSSDKHK
jgi:hypothetical protein